MLERELTLAMVEGELEDALCLAEVLIHRERLSLGYRLPLELHRQMLETLGPMRSAPVLLTGMLRVAEEDGVNAAREVCVGLLAQASAAQDDWFEARIRVGFANLCRRHDLLSDAATSYQKALELLEHMDRPVALARTRMNLAVLYMDQSHYEYARPLVEEAIETFTEHNVLTSVGTGHLNLAIIERELCQPHSALEHAQRALVYKREQSDRHAALSSEQNLQSVQINAWRGLGLSALKLRGEIQDLAQRIASLGMSSVQMQVLHAQQLFGEMNLLEDVGEHATALELCRRGLSELPENSERESSQLVTSAWILHALGRDERALEVMEKVRGLHNSWGPGQAYGFALVALLHTVLGDVTPARIALEKAESFIPKSGTEPIHVLCSIVRGYMEWRAQPDTAPVLELLEGILKIGQRARQRVSFFDGMMWVRWCAASLMRELPRGDVRAMWEREAVTRQNQPALLLQGDGAWGRLPGGDTFELSTRPALARALSALVYAGDVGQSTQGLIEVLYPGQTPSPGSGANRIYKTLSLLRGAGLGPYLNSHEGVYRLGGVRVVVIPKICLGDKTSL